MKYQKYLKQFPNILTFANGASGISSIYASLTGNFGVAASLLAVSFVLDGFDGYLAKWLHAQSVLGEYLDSFCDIISFGVAPWLLVLSLFGADAFTFALGGIFVLCGAFRLARYHALERPYFIGMPITFNGVIFPLLYVFDASLPTYQAAIAISAVLMASTIRVRRIL